mgnify:CR=1 FL=1
METSIRPWQRSRDSTAPTPSQPPRWSPRRPRSNGEVGEPGDWNVSDSVAVAGFQEAKRSFGAMRKQYALHGREQDFRNIQKRVALKRIHHDEAPKPGA